MPRPSALEGETEREYAWRVYPNDARELLLPSAAPTRRCGQPLCAAPIWWGVIGGRVETDRDRRKRSDSDAISSSTRCGERHRVQVS
jgi:hypothetical protein